MRKRCELCRGDAKVHCESDQASLCWDCDGKVHGANFLVEKHVRVLLCGSCSAPAPWKASGARLGSAVTVCEACFGDREGSIEVLCGGETLGGVDHDECDEDEDGEVDVDEDEDEESEEEEDGENQVVPWACNSPSPLDSSSSTGEIGSELDDSLKSRTNRTHQITDANSDYPERWGSCAPYSKTTWATMSSNPSFRPAKRQRRVDESMQSILRNELYLGEEEQSRMASRMVNLMQMLHDPTVSHEASADSADS